MKEFRKWAIESGTALSQQVTGLLRTPIQGNKAYSFTSTLAVTGPSLLCKAGTEQGPQVLGASTAVQTYAAIDGRGSEWFFTLFQQKSVSWTSLNTNTFLQSVLTRRKRGAKSGLLQYVPTTKEALLITFTVLHT